MNCPICTDQLTRPVKWLACDHQVCGSCLDDWIANKAEIECPICRAAIPIEQLKRDEKCLIFDRSVSADGCQIYNIAKKSFVGTKLNDIENDKNKNTTRLVAAGSVGQQKVYKFSLQQVWEMDCMTGQYKIREAVLQDVRAAKFFGTSRAIFVYGPGDRFQEYNPGEAVIVDHHLADRNGSSVSEVLDVITTEEGLTFAAVRYTDSTEVHAQKLAAEAQWVPSEPLPRFIMNSGTEKECPSKLCYCNQHLCYLTYDTIAGLVTSCRIPILGGGGAHQALSSIWPINIAGNLPVKPFGCNEIGETGFILDNREILVGKHSETKWYVGGRLPEWFSTENTHNYNISVAHMTKMPLDKLLSI